MTQQRLALQAEIEVKQAKEWVGGLWIDLQLARQQLRDCQQSLAKTKLELQQMKARSDDGS